MLKKYSGFLISAVAGYLALVVSPHLPLLDSSALALFTGILLSGVLAKSPDIKTGLALASKTGLQYSIILLGFRLSFGAIQGLGLWSYGITIPMLLMTLGLAYLLGRGLKLSKNLSLLLGFGTAICGGSAIASATPILGADEDEVGLALSTVFLYNVLALFLFPAVGQVLHLSQEVFGIWAGAAINDTSSVVAAGYGYGQLAGDTATVVKLARTLLIIPACLGFALARFGKSPSGQLSRLKAVFPTFVLWFLLASFVTSLGLVPPMVVTISTHLSKWLMATALFAVGSKMSIRQIKAAGIKPLLLGGLLWLILSVVSLGLLHFVNR